MPESQQTTMPLMSLRRQSKLELRPVSVFIEGSVFVDNVSVKVAFSFSHKQQRCEELL